jgi:hypothetical protein
MGETSGSAKRAGMVTGLFRDRESAQRAYGSLTDRGYGQAEEGIIHSRGAQVGKVATELIKTIAQHRAWSREKKDQPPV